MAATQDGLGRVARKQGIEGHGTQEARTDILRIQEKKHQNSEYHSLPTGLRKVKAFLADEYLHKFQTHQDQSYFYLISREVLPQFQSQRGTT